MDVITRAAHWAGVPLDGAKREKLETFSQWLAGEAVAAGGIGPHEADRIRSRHVADALLFAAGWQKERPPDTVLDLGSGVGLPGIPLAIVWPRADVRLVDRSRRRLDLVRRAVRMLELGAVAVEADASAYTGAGADLVVSRAAAHPTRVLQWANRLVLPGGMVVVGGSHRERPASVAGEEVVEVPPTVLDRPAWLRMMAAT